MLTKMRTKWRMTTIGRSATVLTRNDQRKIAIVVLVQIFLSIMDLIGVALIGVLGAIAISGVGAQRSGSRILTLLEFLQIDQQSLVIQSTIIGLAAAGMLGAEQEFLQIYFLGCCNRIYFSFNKEQHSRYSTQSRLEPIR